jgi:hypothetical protein
LEIGSPPAHGARHVSVAVVAFRSKAFSDEGALGSLFRVLKLTICDGSPVPYIVVADVLKQYFVADFRLLRINDVALFSEWGMVSKVWQSFEISTL